jgi:hypothetical protein
VVPALVLVALAGGAAWWAFRPAAEPPPPPVTPPPDDRPEPSPAGTLGGDVHRDGTGVLVVRVRTTDGSVVPAKTRAGFAPPEGSPRMRTVVDGTVRFTDAPVGTVAATAEAEGYEAAEVDVVVMDGVPAEAVVVLTRR